ncbi:MAG: AAA family ATPase [bacterium]|nr:AAA family ATPase [bacterium]
MFEKYYQFKRKPFSLTPDPDFFYLSPDHVEAIEHLIYGITDGEGFLMLTGEIGTGKTTLSRVLTRKLGDSIIYSLTLNPFQDFEALLKSIISDFGLTPGSGGKSDLIDQLIHFLLHDVGPRGKTALIIIDEAQNLSVETLEQLRLISNIETDREKLLQILLLGQEELMQMIELNELRQLNQRISVRYFLTPLNKAEMTRYIHHRIQASREPQAAPITFTWTALREIFKFSRGVPRLINMLANRCLIAGFVAETHTIDRTMVKRAKESLFGDKYKKIKKIKDKKYRSGSNGRTDGHLRNPHAPQSPDEPPEQLASEVM